MWVIIDLRSPLTNLSHSTATATPGSTKQPIEKFLLFFSPKAVSTSAVYQTKVQHHQEVRKIIEEHFFSFFTSAQFLHTRPYAQPLSSVCGFTHHLCCYCICLMHGTLRFCSSCEFNDRHRSSTRCMVFPKNEFKDLV